MHNLEQAYDEDQKYLLGKLLWVFLPFIVRFLGIIISSVGTEQDFRPGGSPLRSVCRLHATVDWCGYPRMGVEVSDELLW